MYNDAWQNNAGKDGLKYLSSDVVFDGITSLDINSFINFSMDDFTGTSLHGTDLLL